ncbi:hypothetical protein RR48_14321 [Papilio machaon]|uniref:Uncharacterized protein n=1 Tax=Papilio machaon TaxID=76193 RepID=A0A194QM28_PAPMA|nr:hypothetical protein RR48_14321 [Papilio machaon]
MESSEDDAGTATNASRRPSAREKDIRQAEDICATGSFQQDSSEARDSCKTPAMSEDNFDGDSVPSPSTQDVNTSTEAILDMIDEIVDGPGAPKRVPLTVEKVECAPKIQSNNRLDEQKQTSHCESEDPLTQPSNIEQAVISKTHDESPIEDDNIGSSSNNSLRETADLSETCNITVSEKNADPTTSHDTEASNSVTLPSSPNPRIPASSVVQTDQSVSDKNEETCERTVKCVTSSDSQDNVVGSAECSSSDTSLSDRVPVSENVTKPLRRRLIRPAPSDRRPDSTVSSTVDLQSINVEAHEQSSSECVVKDVSSSSDAVPPLHGNVKPDEIRNVSEISICKAETSTSPTKKIKLIRQKVLPQVTYTDNSHINKSPVREQCQSTCEILPNESTSEVNVISTSKSDIDKEILDNNKISIDTVSNTPDVSTVILNESPVEENNTELQLNESSSNKLELEESLKDLKKIPPIKIHLSVTSASETAESTAKLSEEKSDSSCSNIVNDESESAKQVPKLTIKLGNKQPEETKPPVPKLTIKPIRPPSEEENKTDFQEQIPCITKLNIKPIPKRPVKINDEHRKSSSSEISESECSENDESTSTSDQASASDQGPADVVPKVTIKLGKAGTEAEGQFYTEKNIPKLTIKGIQQNENDNPDGLPTLKLVISQSDDSQTEKIPKLTIKTVAKSDSQPLSPKLTIKPIKPPETAAKDSTSCSELTDIQQIPKLKISTDSFTPTIEGKDRHIPKITIKPILNTENLKKVSSNETYEQIPAVTKLNIKPIPKPTDSTDMTEIIEDNVPVVSKINIKPVIKPKDNEIDCNREDIEIPKITKINIKPIKKPDVKSEEKDCDPKVELDENNIPAVTKINIKPIIKPEDEDISKGEISENQSSETGNSSDDNTDIPVVTKINIKPILKPSETEISNVDSIPVVSKINIKPIVKPEENTFTLSPKKESLRSLEHRNSIIPIVTKLNIKPVLKPDEVQNVSDDCEEMVLKNPPLVMKINMKTVDSGSGEKLTNSDKCGDNEKHINSVGDNISVLSKSNFKVSTKSVKEVSNIKTTEYKEHDSATVENTCSIVDAKVTEDQTNMTLLSKQN